MEKDGNFRIAPSFDDQVDSLRTAMKWCKNERQKYLSVHIEEVDLMIFELNSSNDFISAVDVARSERPMQCDCIRFPGE